MAEDASARMKQTEEGVDNKEPARARKIEIGSIITLLAIACTAFFVADLAHEGLGHGGACVALGGKMLSLSTTYEDCSIRSRWIDAAGPVMGLVISLLAWSWLRLAAPRSSNLRAFLCLLFAFTGFWNVGYLVESGILYRGDWRFVIEGLEPVMAWRAGLVIGGVVFYIVAMRVLGAVMTGNFGAGTGWRPQIFGLIALLVASALAIAGGALDPRGSGIILTDALPAALSSFGLVWIGLEVHRRVGTLRIDTPTSPGWIVTGLICAVIFVAVLGPGLRF